MALFVGGGPSNRLVTDSRSSLQKGLKRRLSCRPAVPTFVGRQGRCIAHQPSAGTFHHHYTAGCCPYPRRRVREGGAPAVRIKLWNMGQDIEEWLWPNDQENRTIDLGLLTVECLSGRAASVGPKDAPVTEVGPFLHEVAATSAGSSRNA